MMDERIDHTTGNIWGKDGTGKMVLIGNVMDQTNVASTDKVTASMSKKEGVMQSCCTEYNNIHPVSWRDTDGKWHLVWRCEICQRTMDLVVNAKNSFPYIGSSSPMVIPKTAIVIEHSKPDLQQIRAIEIGADIYRAEREKAVPSELSLFEGACPNCAYQPLSGKATADHSTVYKCSTCGLVYKIREDGKYYRYFGTTDLDVVDVVTSTSSDEEQNPDETTSDVSADTPLFENQETSDDNEVPDPAIAETSDAEASAPSLQEETDTPEGDPIIPETFRCEQTTTEENIMTQSTDGMVHPTEPVVPAPLHEILDDRNLVSQEPAVTAPTDTATAGMGIPASGGLEDIDLSSAMSAGLDLVMASSGRIDVRAPSISVSGKMQNRSTTTASDIISTGTSTVTEVRVSVQTSDTDSPITAKTENVVAVHGHVTSMAFVHDHVPTDDSVKYTMHPNYNGEPATFMKIRTKTVTRDADNSIRESSFVTMIQVHPDIHVEIDVMSYPHMKSVCTNHIGS